MTDEDRELLNEFIRLKSKGTIFSIREDSELKWSTKELLEFGTFAKQKATKRIVGIIEKYTIKGYIYRYIEDLIREIESKK